MINPSLWLHGCKYHNEKKDKPMVYLTVTLLYGKVGYLEKLRTVLPLPIRKVLIPNEIEKDNPNGSPSFNRYLASMAAFAPCA